MAGGRRRLNLDAINHPVVFALVCGAIFAVVSFALAGLWRGWTADSLVTSICSGFILWGPGMAIWARRKRSGLDGDLS